MNKNLKKQEVWFCFSNISVHKCVSKMIQYSKRNYICQFLFDTDPSSISFYSWIFYGKNRVYSFENTFELFERSCQGFRFLFTQIRSLYGWDLFHLTSYINMRVWSTEVLLRDFCGIRYLKNHTKLLVNSLFSMYINKMQRSIRRIFHMIRALKWFQIASNKTFKNISF